MSGCNHSHLRDNSTSSASFLEIDFSSCPNVVFFTSSEKSSKVFLEIAPFLKTRSDSAAAAVRFKISLKNSPADLRVNVRATIDAGSASSRAIAIYRPVRL